MKIAILGFGSVGQKLALLFSQANHRVIVGLHKSNPANGFKYQFGTFEEVVKEGDVIILAIPFVACQEALPPIASLIAGKIVVDSTNPLNSDWSPLLLGEENSAGEEINHLLPEAYVIKAFNTIFADVMQSDRQKRGELAATAFVAGDDPLAKQTVLGLAKDIGFSPVDAGPLRSARYLEAMANLNIEIAVGQAGGTNAAFLYHQAGV